MYRVRPRSAQVLAPAAVCAFYYAGYVVVGNTQMLLSGLEFERQNIDSEMVLCRYDP
jgi:hypothetical protein